jgi:hypothetical protein
MSYDILTIRTADANDGYVYPIFGEDDRLIELEDLDGQRVQTIDVHAIDVRQGARRIAHLQKISATLYITEARVAVACEKYDKGGGWTGFSAGAMATAMAINAVSKARASRRRKGKMLMGHVRYEWLHQVGFSPKRFGVDEQLRLMVTDGSNRTLTLDLHLPKNIDSGLLAQDIVQRAARFRLNHTKIKPENVDKMKDLELAGRIPPAEKNFAMYVLPTYFRVGTQPPNTDG